jgi:hypothetical protein
LTGRKAYRVNGSGQARLFQANKTRLSDKDPDTVQAAASRLRANRARTQPVLMPARASASPAGHSRAEQSPPLAEP